MTVDFEAKDLFGKVIGRFTGSGDTWLRCWEDACRQAIEAGIMQERLDVA